MSSRVKPEPLIATSSGLDAVDVDAQPMNVDEQDEVLREIDVYLSPEISKHLYLMQYPLQQHDHIGSRGPQVARMKPRHCKVELEYPTKAADEEDSGDYNGQFFLSSRTFSSQTIPVSTHMALGKFVTDGDPSGATPGLHLVPITHITQMRPSFDHVNEATMQASATAEEELEAQKQALESANSGRKPLAFQKKESERAALARKSSYAFKKASEESEIWHPLEVYAEGSEESTEIIQKVCSSVVEQNLLLGPKERSTEAKDAVMSSASTANTDPSPTSLSPYLQSLNYLPQRADDIREKESRVFGAESQSMSELMPKVVSRMTQLLHKGWPVPFSVLRSQFDGSLTNETLFRALNSCAFLVGGNFILQSRLLPLSPYIQQLRTFVLFLLQTFGSVHRARLEKVYEENNQVSNETILMILLQVGKKTENGWKLKVDEDPTFRRKYPDAIPVHVKYWAEQMQRFEPLFERYSS